MPRFSDRETNLRCGTCDRALDIDPGSQELAHVDGTPLCDLEEIAFDLVEEEPREQRWEKAAARYLTRSEPYAERTRRPFGWGSALLFLALAAAIVGGLIWTMSELAAVLR